MYCSSGGEGCQGICKWVSSVQYVTRYYCANEDNWGGPTMDGGSTFTCTASIDIEYAWLECASHTESKGILIGEVSSYDEKKYPISRGSRRLFL